MPTSTATRVCNFVWYELHTPDSAAAQSFYSEVLGWGTQDAGMPDGGYTLLNVGTTPIGGILQKPAKSFSATQKPGWLGYIAVDDVDGYAQRVQEAAGVVHHAPTDIPAVGRFAVVADPQGAIFVLFKPLGGRQQPELPAPGTPGTGAWHDLIASDLQSAFAFYSELFGWSKGDSMDMGPNGTYQVFNAGPAPIGGMMNRMDPSQNPSWLFYFKVAAMDAAVALVQQHGGKVVHGPSEVPGGQHIAHCVDPQGALFAICD